MREWLIREVAGRVLALLLGALVAGLTLAGLLPPGTELQLGGVPQPVAHATLPKPSVSSSNTRVVVEPATRLPGSPAWSGFVQPPR